MEDQEKPESPLQKPALPPPPGPLEDPLPKKKRPQTCCKCCKIFCCILFLIILVLIAVCLFFYFFIFKKRAVQITTTSATLENLSYSIVPITLNLVMGMNIGVKNPNYAGYNYESTNTTITYHGIPAGIALIPANVVKARSSKKLHITVYMNATTMINSPFLLQELIAGTIPLFSRTYLTGKVTLFNIIKIHATVLNTCDITVNLQSTSTSTTCKADIKVF